MTIADFSNVPGTPASSHQVALETLAKSLNQAHYFTEKIAELLGDGAFSALMRDQIVPAQLRVEQLLASTKTTEEQKSLCLLISFFLLGELLTEQDLNRAFAVTLSNGAQLLRALRLSEIHVSESDRPQYRASFELRPHAADDGVELWVASDLPAHIRRSTLRKDHVLGIGHASRSLAQFTERREVQKALDVGTGCGIQTFHLLAHCQHVTATDISERALGFTAFNLLLNADALGIQRDSPEQRVTLKLGSLLEPVQGEEFNLVVSNPPFVITPRNSEETAESQFTYRDGGLAGDQIVSALLKEIPSVLAPGGSAQMLGNWEVQESLEPTAHQEEAEAPRWDERPRQWIAEGIDAWFIQREALSPEQYAETWLRDSSETSDRQGFEEAYRNYLIDFASRRVESIGFGMIWLRKPALEGKNNLLRFEEITYPIQQPLAPFIAEAVELFDAVAHLEDSELEALHLVVASDVTEERHAQPGAEHPGVILLREGAGLRRTILESTATAGFVSACDGELNVGQIVGALASLLDWEGSAERQELLAHVRELILKGFLRIDSGN